MYKLMISRLLQGLLVIFGATVVAFFIVRVIPGDPARMISPQATEEQIQALRAELGFDKPIPILFVDFLSSAVRGDFGNSVYLRDPVTSLIIQKFRLTMVLGLCGLGLALLIAVPLGVLGALKRGTLWDRLTLFISTIILSMPNFWLGLVLMFLVAVKWTFLPAQGFTSWRNLILPSITLSMTLMPMLIRTTRAIMIDVLGQDFIKALRCRGVPLQRIIFKHAFKNIAVPMVTLLGIQLGQLLGGALVIEYVFNFPGLGLLMFKAVLRRDYPLVQGITVVIATIFVLLNLIVDLSYSYLDPRIRRQELAQ